MPTREAGEHTRPECCSEGGTHELGLQGLAALKAAGPDIVLTSVAELPAALGLPGEPSF